MGNENARPEAAAADPETALVALRQILRTTGQRSRQVQREAGVTTPQLLVLRSIAELGEVTTGRLAARVSLSQPTVTAIVERLAARGLIDRYRSETDRRVVHNRLTRRGRRAMEAAPPLLDEEFMARFASLPAERRREIVATLRTVATLVGADADEAAPLLDLDSAVADSDGELSSY